MQMIKQLLSKQPQAPVGPGTVDDLLPAKQPLKAAEVITVSDPVNEVKINYEPEHIEHMVTADIPHVSTDMRNSRFFKSLMARHPEAIDTMLDWV